MKWKKNASKKEITQWSCLMFHITSSAVHGYLVFCFTGWNVANISSERMKFQCCSCGVQLQSKQGKTAWYPPRRFTSLTARSLHTTGFQTRLLLDPICSISCNMRMKPVYKREIKWMEWNVPSASKNNDYTLNIPLYGLQTKQFPLIRFLHWMLIRFNNKARSFKTECADFSSNSSCLFSFQMFSSWAQKYV